MITDTDGLTTYSEMIAGDEGNFDQRVRFDNTDGYIGITQFNGSERNAEVRDRILLSPGQVKALIDFAKGR